MARTISAAVGRWAPNRSSDVKTVQQLLNKAKPRPKPLLVEDGVCGRLTRAAIRAFQDYHFHSHDERVDPGHRTIRKLNQFDTPGTSATPPPGTAIATPPGPGGTAQLSALRTRIVDIAKSQATPPPGKVSDLVTVRSPQTNRAIRAGWRRLKEFFDLAVANWPPQVWKVPGYLEGVQIPGRRVPQPGTSGVQWCGIFATWVLIKAGMKVHWTLGRGINLERVRGLAAHQARPGDVCVKKGGTIHHFIPITDDDPMLTVNGNSDAQSILIKPIERSLISYYYKVD